MYFNSGSVKKSSDSDFSGGNGVGLRAKGNGLTAFGGFQAAGRVSRLEISLYQSGFTTKV